MTTTSEYYSISINSFPFKSEKAREVGCYSTRKTAECVAKFIGQTFEQRVSGGIDIAIEGHQGDMIQTPIGLRLKETPNGAITLIHEDLSEKEKNRLLEFLPLLLKSKIIKSEISTPTIDKPKYMCEGEYYCIVLNFEPFDRSHMLFAGYYQTKKTAEVFCKYIINMHCKKKIGCGFDMKIERHKGKFIEYESGRQCIKVGKIGHEILSSCDSKEFVRISKVVDESIKRWA